jgi:hypothetical protein
VGRCLVGVRVGSGPPRGRQLQTDLERAAMPDMAADESGIEFLGRGGRDHACVPVECLQHEHLDQCAMRRVIHQVHHELDVRPWVPLTRVPRALHGICHRAPRPAGRPAGRYARSISWPRIRVTGTSPQPPGGATSKLSPPRPWPRAIDMTL